GADWGDDRGSWHVHLLPYMEQDNLYRAIPNLKLDPKARSSPDNRPPAEVNAVGKAWNAGILKVKLPYLRCPSDDSNQTYIVSNYVGSLGPQCSTGGCGFDPYQIYCHPNTSGLGDWGYSDPNESYNHGNAWDASNIKGMFNRLGARISMAMVRDGLSNTILI